jgi:hypothetical protein
MNNLWALARCACSAVCESAGCEAVCAQVYSVPGHGRYAPGPSLGETDGIMELWFDDTAGIHAFLNSLSYINVIGWMRSDSRIPKKCEYFFQGNIRLSPELQIGVDSRPV